MTKQEINEFTLRISQANHSKLVLIMYDVILNYIEEAIELEKNGSMEEFVTVLKKTQKMQQELLTTVQYNSVETLDVLQLYLFVNKTLIQAIMKKDASSLQGVHTVMSNLRVAFEEVSKYDTDGPIMINTQQVYAGLTYGKGYLNETFVDPIQQSRGFKA